MSNSNWGQPSITYSSNPYSTNTYSTVSVSVSTTTTTVVSSVSTGYGYTSFSSGGITWISSSFSSGHGSATGTRTSTSAGWTSTPAPNNVPPGNPLLYCNNPQNYTFYEPSFSPADCPGFCPTDLIGGSGAFLVIAILLALAGIAMIWCRERTERRLTFYIIFYQALVWLVIALVYFIGLKELTPFDVGVALWIVVGVNAAIAVGSAALLDIVEFPFAWLHFLITAAFTLALFILVREGKFGLQPACTLSFPLGRFLPLLIASFLIWALVIVSDTEIIMRIIEFISRPFVWLIMALCPPFGSRRGGDYCYSAEGSALLITCILSARVFWTLVLLIFDVFWIIFAFLYFHRANKTPEFLDVPEDRERHISNLQNTIIALTAMALIPFVKSIFHFLKCWCGLGQIGNGHRRHNELATGAVLDKCYPRRHY